jgi:voltage-gated potassium channel
LLTGTVGYWFIGEERYDFVDCLYMTVITITTIGFTEVIDLRGEPFNELFTMFIAFTGIGSTTFIFSNFTALIIEGELKNTFRRRKMEKKVSNYTGHYIICGVGRVGKHIFRELHSTGRLAVCIEKDPGILKEVLENFPDAVAIEGDADVEDILLKAGIKNAKGLFAATGDDNQNLVISLTAKYLNPAIRVVARCLDAVNQTKMKKAGADSVITENFIAGMRMASEMVRPTVVSFLDRMLADRDENLRVEEIVLHEKYTGMSIADLELNEFPDTLVLAVASGEDWIYNPKGHHQVKLGSKLVVITNPEERARLQSRFID